MSHATHVNESCHTFKRDSSHENKEYHVSHINDSCHALEWAMLHTWMSHVKHMNESCHTHE